MQLKVVLIISYSPLYRDPRVLRQIQTLKNDFHIITIGTASSNDNTIEHYDTFPKPRNLNRFILFRIFRRLKVYYNKFIFLFPGYSRKLSRILNDKYFLSQNITEPDIIIANDWSGLYLAYKLKTKWTKKPKIYFDSHEYWPKIYYGLGAKYLLVMQNLINRALQESKNDISIMSTVSEGLADEYERYFSFPANSVKIITNAPVWNPMLKPTKPKKIIKLIHHGSAAHERNLELMIKMMKYLEPDKYELTFMVLKRDAKYYNYLVTMSKDYTNIKFVDPVPFNEIIPTINHYDIGVYIMEDKNFNHRYALPNKLFEFIQARLAIAIGLLLKWQKLSSATNWELFQ